MERKIELKLVNKDHYWMKGIYLIRIGEMRYVGKSDCIGTRMQSHQSSINRGLGKFYWWKNFGFKTIDEEKSNKGYYILCDYLFANPQIKEGTVEVIQRDVCSNMMCLSEKYYIREFIYSTGCYNVSLNSSLGNSEKHHLWDVEEKDGSLEYFDRRLPKLRVSTIKDNKQNKEVIKAIVSVKKGSQFKVERLGELKDRLIEANPEHKGKILTYIIGEIQKVYRGEI